MRLAGHPLLTWRFASLNACYFSLCASLAPFFFLQAYIDSLGIGGAWNGLLMGAIGLGALGARPFIAPHLGSLRACLVCLALSTVALELSLASYFFAGSFGSLLAVRLFNGLGFAGVFCAVVALSPYSFESDCGGVAFSAISIVCLLPFIILPPLLNWMEVELGSFWLLVLSCGAPLALSAPLAMAAFARHGESIGEAASPGLPLRQCVVGLGRPWMLAAMFATFSFYYSYAWVFYNSYSLCKEGGVSNPGALLGVATFFAIGFRLLAGRRLDGRWRTELLVGALLLNALATFLLGAKGVSVWGYTAAFVAFGISWGAAVPLLLSAVMERSAKEEQGFNLNMSSQMQDLGYFMGPLLGGGGLRSEFFVSLAGGLASMSLLRKKNGTPRP